MPLKADRNRWAAPGERKCLVALALPRGLVADPRSVFQPLGGAVLDRSHEFPMGNAITTLQLVGDQHLPYAALLLHELGHEPLGGLNSHKLTGKRKYSHMQGAMSSAG
jgi:hypothetical protein